MTEFNKVERKEFEDLKAKVLALTANADQVSFASKRVTVVPDYHVALSGFTKVQESAVIVSGASYVDGTWVTKDISQFVPHDASLILVSARGAISGAYNDAEINMRRSEADDLVTGTNTEVWVAGVSGIDGTCRGTALVDIVRSYAGRTVDYQFIGATFYDFEIKIIGYFKISKVSGTGFDTAISSDGSGGGSGSGSSFSEVIDAGGAFGGGLGGE